MSDFNRSRILLARNPTKMANLPSTSGRGPGRLDEPQEGSSYPGLKKPYSGLSRSSCGCGQLDQNRRHTSTEPRRLAIPRAASFVRHPASRTVLSHGPRRGYSRWMEILRLLSLIACLLLLATAPAGESAAQSSGSGKVAPSTPTVAATTAVGSNFTAPTPSPSPSAAGRAGVQPYFSDMPTPTLLVVISSIGALIAATISAIAAVFVNPRTALRVAATQAAIGRDAVDAAQRSADAAMAGATAADRSAKAATDGAAAADKGASAATLSASAAGRSAETAALNASNIGIHEVARRRQDWINTVREELAHLHSDLANWVPLKGGSTEVETAAHAARVRATNSRTAKLKLLLNPREVASRRLLDVIRRLDSNLLSSKERLWLCRWFIRWSQIILKTEWDRVRNETLGEQIHQARRRGDRH